jgi:putative phosphoesterase
VLLAVLSDIHGNLPALEAVLAVLEDDPVDELVCLGDVAVGPQPTETLDRIRTLGCPVVMGNWDAWVIEGFPQVQEDPWKRFVEQGEWWARKLSPDDRAFIRTFEPRLELQLGGTEIIGFHGSSSSYDDMILATTPHEELLRLLADYQQPLMLGGHSHVQLVRVVEGRLLVNPGSVGLPFRGVPLGELQRMSPWAEYALVRIDHGRASVELRRTRYDVERMLQQTIESGAPHAVWWAETWVRDDQHGAPLSSGRGAPRSISRG